MKTLVHFALVLVPMGLIAWGCWLIYPPCTPLVVGGICFWEIRKIWSAPK